MNEPRQSSQLNALPVVVIVGRPNVGKSSFLNRLAGERISIVEDTPGVTRDRVSTVVTAGDRKIEVVDTGGIGIVDSQDLSAHIEEQIDVALEMAHVVVFLTDARDGVTALDRQVADRLRRLGKPTVLAVNKADSPVLEETAMEFYSLGLGEPVPMSIHQSFNTTEVLDRVRELLAEMPEDDGRHEGELLLAVCGKRNAGKSTFVNALAREERVIVSEIAGTTRDAVDVRFEKDGHVFVAIDTAGLRRKKSIQGDIEFYAQARAERAIRRADVVLHLMDAPSEISSVDKKIAQLVSEHWKPVVLVINKWDLAKGQTTPEAFEEYLQQQLPGLHYAPVVLTTAQNGRNVWRAIEVAQDLRRQSRVRVPTAEFNRLLERAVAQQRPFSSKRKRKSGKILYGTQVAVSPPAFVLMVNDVRCFEDTWLRYLQNLLREKFDFPEVPLRIMLRQRRPAAERTEGVPAQKPNPTPSELEPEELVQEGGLIPHAAARDLESYDLDGQALEDDEHEVWEVAVQPPTTQPNTMQPSGAQDLEHPLNPPASDEDEPTESP